MKVDSAEMGQAVAQDVLAAGAVDRVCVAGYGARSAAAARAALPGAASSATHPEVRLAVYRGAGGVAAYGRPSTAAIRCRNATDSSGSCRRASSVTRTPRG